MFNFIRRLFSKKNDPQCPVCRRIFTLGTVDEPASQEEIDEMTERLNEVISDPRTIMITTPRLRHLSH